MRIETLQYVLFNVHLDPRTTADDWSFHCSPERSNGYAILRIYWSILRTTLSPPIQSMRCNTESRRTRRWERWGAGIAKDSMSVDRLLSHRRLKPIAGHRDSDRLEVWCARIVDPPSCFRLARRRSRGRRRARKRTPAPQYVPMRIAPRSTRQSYLYVRGSGNPFGWS